MALLGLTTLTPTLVAAQAATPTPATQPSAPPGDTMARAVTVDQITDNPTAYYGAAVSIVGDVEDVLGPRAFTVEDQDLLLDETLLVVSAAPFAGEPNRSIQSDDLQSQTVMVRGTVHQFNQSAFEDRLGIQFDDSRVADWAGRPALIAERLAIWTPAMSAPWPNDATSTSTGGRSSTTIEALAESPAAYREQAVTVGGYVESVLGSRAFVIEDGDLLAPEQVLVVTDQPLQNLPSGSDRGLSTDGFVWVSGTAHQFNQAAFEQQLGIELEDSRLSEWAGRSAIIAESIVPVRWGAERHPPVMPNADAADNQSDAEAQGTEDLPGASGSSTGGLTTGVSEGDPNIDAILSSPESYGGQTTTLTGQVGRQVGPRSFVLTDEDAEGEQLLVVSALSLPSAFAYGEDGTPDAGQRVQVTGEIWQFSLAAVEERIGLGLDDALFGDWADRTVMIATAITPASS